MFTRVPIEIKFVNSCPTNKKFKFSGQDMSLPIVIQFGGWTKGGGGSG